MKKLFPFFASAAFLASCESAPKNSVTNYSDDYIFDTVYKVYEADFSTTWTGGQDLVWIDNSMWMEYNFCNSGALMLRNIDGDSIIKMNITNPDCEKLHTIANENGFYVVTQHNDLLFYPKGSTVSTFLFNIKKEIPAFASSGMTADWYKPGGDEKYNVPENTVYFRVNQNFEDTIGKYSAQKSSFPISAKLNTETRKLEFFGKVPDFTARRQYGLLSNVYDLYSGDSIIYTNAVNGKITVVNTIAHSEKQFSGKSKFDKESIRMFDQLRIKQQYVKQEMARHKLLSAYYEPLFYNPSDNKYYRLFHPEMNELKEDGLKNTEFDKRTVLMIFDSNFKIIDEIELPVKGNGFIKIFPLQEGVALSVQDGLKQNGKHVTLPIFRIRKK